MSQLKDIITYDEALKIINDNEKKYNIIKKYHLGQIKLLYSEILYLSKHIEDMNDKTIVLYVGAAEGYHISKLADMFPKVNFELWDPNPFKLEERKNIKKYNKFFTDKTAEQYKENGNNILFICDIRTVEMGDYKKINDHENMDKIVIDDMNSQMRWVKIINPITAYLKYRVPYVTPTIEYYSGTIYLQPYSPISTETRILVRDYKKTELYNNKENEEKMLYFNIHIRPNVKYNEWNDIIKKYNIKNNWDNNYALNILDYYLKQTQNKHTNEDIGNLFMDIINFHKKKYGKKYNIIFNKN